MRKFFMLLLVGLVAFRALAGDVMAVNMNIAQGLLSAELKAQATVALGDAAALRMPCHGADSGEASDEQTAQCKTCQVCHLSAFATPSLAAPVAYLPSVVPVLLSESFASAEPLRVSKPPIL